MKKRSACWSFFHGYVCYAFERATGILPLAKYRSRMFGVVIEPRKTCFSEAIERRSEAISYRVYHEKKISSLVFFFVGHAK
ncbi:MAG: hypothetical protein LBC95_01360 [Candidatus Nomurabacteria bacterium]|jgi:hypothetical protein|nr:hypothetical protein [Candidatus Nomurabacteria bacterium]